MAASSTTAWRCSLLLLALVAPMISSSAGADSPLTPTYYGSKCPLLETTVRTVMIAAIGKERRMGASLLRLHFHDCFVQGCDASILLDDVGSFVGEKTAFGNINSVRGYEVIDQIKAAVELVCPGVVSCADILALAARDGVNLLGGPYWPVNLGRRDSTTASRTLANSDLPPPFLNLAGLITSFANKGLDARDMTALSGAHTIGYAQCANFRAHIYNDANVNASFAAARRAGCPAADSSLAPLDEQTGAAFDNKYYGDLIVQRGLLHSDQELFNGGTQDALVRQYVDDQKLFFSDFVTAMIKMGNIAPLTGSAGQIRRSCRVVNSS